MKRLLIVADHSFVVEAIRLALRRTAGFQLVGFVDGRAPVCERVAELTPDVVLVDDMQQQEIALARLREAAAEAPGAKLVLLTLRMETDWLGAAFDAGADAVVSKAVQTVSLGTLVREIAQGNVVHNFTPAPRARAGAQVDCPLTDRELEILRLVAEGHTNGRIAAALWVTEQTVKFHLSNIYRKLGVANRTEASHYAHVHELLETRSQRLAS